MSSKVQKSIDHLKKNIETRGSFHVLVSNIQKSGFPWRLGLPGPFPRNTGVFVPKKCGWLHGVGTLHGNQQVQRSSCLSLGERYGPIPARCPEDFEISWSYPLENGEQIQTDTWKTSYELAIFHSYSYVDLPEGMLDMLDINLIHRFLSVFSIQLLSLRVYTGSDAKFVMEHPETCLKGLFLPSGKQPHNYTFFHG